MKTFVPFLKFVSAVFITVFLSSSAVAQSGSGGVSGSGTGNTNSGGTGNDLLTSGLKFSNPTLLTASTTNLKKGAIYLFSSVMTGVDAQVKIEDLVGGAKVTQIDDNSNGLGYKDAFQPEIQSGNIIGSSYAVFSISFYQAGTQIPAYLQQVNATALDIDGSLNLKEFAEINMGTGGVAKYMSTTLDISLLDMLLGKFKGTNILGIERNGIDTTSMGNMFTAVNKNISSFTLKYGTNTLLPTTDTRQFSMYMKGFTYPSQVTLPVDIISFNAMLEGTNKANLTWVTATEKNVSHFVVEKSTDGKNFSDAGIVFAFGNTQEKQTYNFADKISASAGSVIYYRLRTVNLDSKNQYSTIRLIRIDKENSNIAVTTYPNPVTSELRVTVPAKWQNKKVSYELIANNGRLTYRAESGNSSQTETINVSNLTTGVYMVKVTCNGETAMQKIVKQ